MPSPNPDETDTGEAPRFRLNRREWLAGSAAVLGLGGLGGASAHSLSVSAQGFDIGAESVQQQQYDLRDLGDGLYFLTDGAYQNMVLVTDEGVVVVDTPRRLSRVSSQPSTKLPTNQSRTSSTATTMQTTSLERASSTTR